MRLSAERIDDLALGATVLGSGGGGDTRAMALATWSSLRSNGPVDLVAAAELPPDTWVAPIGVVGAVAALSERLPSGAEFAAAVRTLESHLGVTVSAVHGLEIGGANGLVPVLTASSLGLPLVDADGMGRAFPRVDQTVFTAAGLPAAPVVLADSAGRSAVLSGPSNAAVEHACRAVLGSFGGWAAAVQYPMRASDANRHAIAGSFSRAARLGRALRVSHSSAADRVRRLADVGGTAVASGTVLEVRRGTGFAAVTIEPDSGDARTVRVEAADEYLMVLADGAVAVSVPDVICMLDRRSFAPVAVDELRAGRGVDVVSFAAPAAWRHPGAAELVAPEAFGLASPPVAASRSGWVEAAR
ncbi:MAG: DUF917 domain-containing protein [Streptosporangiales bacterium]